MGKEIENVKCECCGQTVRIWKKPLISTAVASLCRLVKMYDGGPIHMDDFTAKASDRNFSQLKLWDLIVPARKDDPKKRGSGKWVPTIKGKSFANGEIEIMKHVVTKGNKVVRFEGPKIGIRKALGSHFDYRTLMGLNRSGVPVRDRGAQRPLWDQPYKDAGKMVGDL